MKIAIVCLLVALAVAEISANVHYQWGVIGPNDRLLYRENVIKKSALEQVVTKDFTYSGAELITGIKCIDQYTNANGAHASLYSGGPGYKDVTVHMKSQLGHGINFIVEVYGNNN